MSPSPCRTTPRRIQSEFLGERRLKDLVKKLSEFIGFPIVLHVENRRGAEKLGDEEENEEGEEVFHEWEHLQCCCEQ